MDLNKYLKGESIMDKLIRLQELRRKNQITNLCKEWMENGIYVSVDNFIGLEETLVIQDKIIAKLDEIDRKETSVVIPREENLWFVKYEEILIENILSNEEYIFFTRDALKIGGLCLKGEIILEKMDFIINESEMHNFGCSVFLCTKNAQKGFCLWKSEYDYRIYIW